MGQERRLGFGDSDRASTSRLRSSREAGAAEASTTRVAMTLKRMVPFPMVPFRIRQGARSGAAPVGPAVTSDLLPRRRGHERIPALAMTDQVIACSALPARPRPARTAAARASARGAARAPPPRPPAPPTGRCLPFPERATRNRNMRA